MAGAGNQEKLIVMMIQIEQNKCIGCGTCAALCPDYFELGDQGKAILKNSASPDKNQLEVAAANCTKEAAECCPAQCINIKE